MKLTKFSSFFRAVVGVCTVWMSVSTAGGGVVVFVDDDAPPGGDGTTWETAYRFLQDGLSFAADPANGVSHIKFAQGVYLPDRDESNPTGSGDRHATFFAAEDVQLFGGYAGIGAADPDERDFTTYISVLSGDLDGDDLPEFVNIAENSFHVVTIDLTSGAVLEGLTIAHGNADGEVLDLYGAGVLNIGSSPMVRFCILRDNSAITGGGFYNTGDGAAPGFLDCTFTGNRALSPGSGGGFRSHEATGQTTFTGCTFESNTAWSGGAISIRHGDVGFVAEQCVFNGNQISGAGGAITVFDMSGVSVLSGCVFANNCVSQGAGGIGGAVYASSAAFDITGCLFVDNAAYVGGAVAMKDTDEFALSALTNCLFAGNAAQHRGGAVYWEGTGAPTFTGCDFEGNSADRGGAVALRAVFDDIDATFQDCTFSDNLAYLRGGAIHLDAQAPASGDARASLLSCTLMNNTAAVDGGAAVALSGDLMLFDCDIVGNTAAFGGGVARTDGALSAIECEFRKNEALSGGAVYAIGGSTNLSDSRIVANSVTTYGAGVFCSGGETTLLNCLLGGNLATLAGGRGGAVAAFGDDTALIQCQLVGNDAGNGGSAAFVSGGAILIANCALFDNHDVVAGSVFLGDVGSHTTVAGSILWNQTGTVFAGEGELLVAYCDVQGGFEGEGNIDADPAFLLEPSPGDDFEWGTDDDEYGDLQLQAGSPCIDAGDNTAVPDEATFDALGNPRFVDDPGAPNTGNSDGKNPIVDMGPFEFQGNSADFNVDGEVDAEDLAILLNSWGPCPPGHCSTDLNNDGVVGPGDLVLVLGNWNT